MPYGNCKLSQDLEYRFFESLDVGWVAALIAGSRCAGEAPLWFSEISSTEWLVTTLESLH